MDGVSWSAPCVSCCVSLLKSIKNISNTLLMIYTHAVQGLSGWDNDAPVMLPCMCVLKDSFVRTSRRQKALRARRLAEEEGEEEDAVRHQASEQRGTVIGRGPL